MSEQTREQILARAMREPIPSAYDDGIGPPLKRDKECKHGYPAPCAWCRMEHEIATLRADLSRVQGERDSLDRIQRENAVLAGEWASRALKAEGERDTLREAGRSLANEAEGFRGMADVETHGYTNLAVLKRRIDEMREALAALASSADADPQEPT